MDNTQEKPDHRPAGILLFSLIRGLYAAITLISFDLDIWANKKPPFFPLYDFFALSPPALDFLKYAYFVAVFLFIVGIRVEIFGCLAAAIKLLAILADMKSGYAFFYLSCLALPAFSLIESRSRGNRNPDSTPLLFLVCSVYFFAGIHKLINFSAMRAEVLWTFDNLAIPSFRAICSIRDCSFFGQAAVWLIGPIEILLGALFTFPRLRRYGFVLAILFHLVLSTIVNVRWVGVSMLTLEAAIAVRGRRIRFPSWPRWILLFSPPVACWVLSLWLFESHSAWARLLAEFLFSSALLWLPASVGMDFFQPGWGPPLSLPKGWFGSYFLFLVIFGASPLLWRYSVSNIGWSMFAGGWHRQNKAYFMKVMAPNCGLQKRYWLVAYRTENSDGSFIYKSSRAEYLQSLKEYIYRACPSARVE
jgi:hypothetical protein